MALNHMGAGMAMLLMMPPTKKKPPISWVDSFEAWRKEGVAGASELSERFGLCRVYRKKPGACLGFRFREASTAKVPLRMNR